MDTRNQALVDQEPNILDITRKCSEYGNDQVDHSACSIRKL
ncbi:hypothetical protein [Heyndrickxia acidicola]|uniref:Uncharacterized protein n=1 Tax=Heyndrickxia acidicola TaxID=209389 RepID=A0ABU6MHG6_9BACI|nr:hypothetical protein [Heyndrickxia acidicola]MED1203083.1 hypothetical protein [Heyndrickxia acidicola]